MSTAQTNASRAPASAAARNPRPVAGNGPWERDSSRMMRACSAGNGWPWAAITKTGSQRCGDDAGHVFDHGGGSPGHRQGGFVAAHAPRFASSQHDPGK